MLASALLLLAGAVLAFVFFRKNTASPPAEVTRADCLSVDSFSGQVKRDSAARVPKRHYSRSVARPFPFDPNRADSSTLCRVGLRSWQVHNLLKYRRKGGRWHSADDFRRLYGLSDADFERLRPYIRIAPEATAQSSRSYASDRRYAEGKRPAYQSVQKFKEGTTVDLNRADTTVLKQIPGIGRYLSGKIVRYRERLGGFVRVDQINEIEDLPEGIARWFTLDTAPQVRKLRINHATFKQIVRHPYLSYEQTKAIANHIRKYGPIRGWNDLRMYREFTETDFARLQPYLSFE